jgi:hypothetical protein
MGAPPAAAGAGMTLPGQPPFGHTPITPPTPPRGLQAEGVSLVANAKAMLEKAIATPGVGAETKIGQAVLKALELIGRELPDGTVTPGQQSAGMEQFMLQQRQANPMQQIIAALGAGGGGPAPPGGGPPPGGAPPMPLPPH